MSKSCTTLTFDLYIVPLGYKIVEPKRVHPPLILALKSVSHKHSIPSSPVKFAKISMTVLMTSTN